MGSEPATSAIDEEAAELNAMADSLATHAPHLATDIEHLQSAFRLCQAAAPHPVEAERAASDFVFDLRALWLRNAADAAASTWRSPTAAQMARLEHSPHDAFGYGRDLRPQALEQRCAAYFDAPSGWSASHVIAASGQSATTLALTALAHGRPLKLAHIGDYFETDELIRLTPALAVKTRPDVADVLLIEPVSCNGALHAHDIAGALRARSTPPQALIIDTTLCGRSDGLADILSGLPNPPPLVLRITSALKLMQGGFELSNAGIISVLAREDAADLADRIRTLRTLTGAGLSESDAIALEAPWFLDAELSARYEAAVFAHNADLAHTVDTANARFDPVEHPALSGGLAPYCAFRLHDPSDASYAALEGEIERLAAERRLQLDKGGSFGFRDHRFEVVRPENGDAPFLRVAMGRRGGWSCEGVVSLMAELAKG